MGGVVAYYGGRVLSNVAVVAVFWTSNVDVDVQQQIGSFYGADHAEQLRRLAAGVRHDRPRGGARPGWVQPAHWSGPLRRRGRHHPFGRVRHDRRRPDRHGACRADRRRLAPRAEPRRGGEREHPLHDRDPSGYTVTLLGAQSCTGFCAYHFTTVIGGKSVPYAVFPDMHGAPARAVRASTTRPSCARTRWPKR